MVNRSVVSRAVLLVAFAVLANVVVTLALAATTNVHDAPSAGGMGVVDGVHWTIQSRHARGVTRVTSTEQAQNIGMTVVTPTEAIPFLVPLPAPDTKSFAGLQHRSAEHLAVGWPLPACRCQLSSLVVDESGAKVSAGLSGGVELPLPPWVDKGGVARARVFPMIPVWRGFFANLVVYACAIAALLWFYRRMVRAGRFDRGRCPCCRYDLRYDYTRGCPECGWQPVGS